MAIYNSVIYIYKIDYIQTKWATTNYTKRHVSTKEGDNVYMGIFIRRQRSLLHRASGEGNCWLKQILFLMRPSDCSSLWKAFIHSLVKRKGIIYYIILMKYLDKIIITNRKVLFLYQMLHFQITRNFNGKFSVMWKTAKRHQENKFWKDRIMKSFQQWQKIMEENGKYVIPYKDKLSYFSLINWTSL